MPTIIWFDDGLSTEHSLVGGKGANLGVLTGAGFTVPPGFNVTTEAYAEFTAANAIDAEITDALKRLDGAQHAEIEVASEAIRELFRRAPVPDTLRSAIGEAYRKLGSDLFVAVRSSGTAEDLADASFAGLHDTYLHIQGVDDLIDAVRGCWSSMWTSRAFAYRVNHGIDQAEVKMAVVVQTMVDSEVSGVMFTGNPLTTATDEIVINASWGLGEAIVQGIVSPDQYTVKCGDLRLKERVLGTKAVETVRDPETGKGTVERDVDAARRGAPALNDAQVKTLGLLGRRVMEHYDGLPQDIEWGMADGTFYLLQARPITGVDFSWDSDCDLWQPEEDHDENVWTRVVADDMWTGAITPLMFSWRGERWSIDVRMSAQDILQHPTLGSLRALKYYKGEAYFNAEVDKIYMRYAPPAVREGLALKLPSTMRPEAIAQPFSPFEYLKVLGRAAVVRPKAAAPYGWVRELEAKFKEVEAAEGLPDDQLPSLSDAEMKRYIAKQIAFENRYNVDICWPGWFIWVRDALLSLNLMLEKWYDGDNPHAYSDLIAGSPVITATVREHIHLHEISKLIRRDPEILDEFNRNQDGSFFTAIESRPEAAELRSQLAEFLEASGHRGHADRDIYFPRYRDDSGVLYRALQAHVKSDVDPMIRERENNRRRAEVQKDVEANLRAKPLGMVKVEAFKAVLQYVLKFQQLRDDERHFIDRNTYSIRKAFLEMNRRLIERDLVDTDRDFWFLTQDELYALLDGRANRPLTRAKIAARMRNFDRFDRKEVVLPKFLYRDRPYDPSDSTLTVGEDNVLRGLPTSRGLVTGTARIVKALGEIDRVNPGEILVVNSTDPGWTPVFALIKGVVVETGGMLSHSSCLAREYGFPAAQIEGALHLIPDGATITLNGDTGEVRIEDADDTPSEETLPGSENLVAVSA